MGLFALVGFGGLLSQAGSGGVSESALCANVGDVGRVRRASSGCLQASRETENICVFVCEDLGVETSASTTQLYIHTEERTPAG